MAESSLNEEDVIIISPCMYIYKFSSVKKGDRKLLVATFSSLAHYHLLLELQLHHFFSPCACLLELYNAVLFPVRLHYLAYITTARRQVSST